MAGIVAVVISPTEERKTDDTPAVTPAAGHETGRVRRRVSAGGRRSAHPARSAR